MLENNEICSSNESFRSTDVAKNTRVVSVSRLHLSYSSVHLLVFFSFRLHFCSFCVVYCWLAICDNYERGKVTRISNSYSTVYIVNTFMFLSQFS